MNQDISPKETLNNVPPDWSVWLDTLRQGWALICVCIILGMTSALLFLHMAKPRYSAYLQLVPVERNSSSISRNLSGLASLAGINLVNEPTSQFNLALETMKSRDVATALADDQVLMRRLFPNQWDAATGQWHPPEDSLRDIKISIKTLLAMPVRPWKKPGAVQVQEHIEQNLSTGEDKQRGIATIVLSDEDPALARDLLDAVYKAADSHLRNRMDIRTQGYIEYISKKLTEVTLAEHREALAQALSDQERTLMMARSGQPFSADALGDVTVTDRPTWPNMPLVLGAGLLAGAIVGVGAAFLRKWMRERRLQR